MTSFNPDLTPHQMDALGVLSGIYNDKDPKVGNFFRVEASMKQWKERWLHESAPMGWYEWYKGYASGKRGPDDERQMRRWYLFKARHLGQLSKADPSLTNLEIQPRRRQALLNWGIAPGMDVEKALKAGNVNQYLEKAASMIQRAKYHANVEKIEEVPHRIASIKYDGANFFVKYDSAGVPTFVSRKLSVKGQPIIKTDRVPHLAKTLPSQAGKVYNVELIHTGHDPKAKENHARVSGLLNALPPRSTSEQERDGPIRAVIFDVIHPKLETYEEKIKHMGSLQRDFGNTDLMFHPEFHVGEEAINRLIYTTRKEGREGVIFVDPTRQESSNPRVKLKHKNHYNLRVTGILQEVDIHGNPKPSAGALTLADVTGRNVGKVGTGFDHATRKDIWANPHEWINKLIQVEAMPPTASKLRSAVYNGDADGGLDKV